MTASAPRPLGVDSATIVVIANLEDFWPQKGIESSKISRTYFELLCFFVA
jgi:hypothetical protein